MAPPAGWSAARSRKRDHLDEAFEAFDHDSSALRNACLTYGLAAGGLSVMAMLGPISVLFGTSAADHGHAKDFSPSKSQPSPLSGGMALQILHAVAFVACSAWCLGARAFIAWAESGGRWSLRVRRHWDFVASAVMLGTVSFWQTARCVADLRRTAPGNSLMTQHVTLTLEFPRGTLPKRTCVDRQPGDTAQLPVKVLGREERSCSMRVHVRV